MAPWRIELDEPQIPDDNNNDSNDDEDVMQQLTDCMKPGWDWQLQGDAPNNISSDIDSSNILPLGSRRQTAAAVSHLLNPVTPTLTPKTYKQALMSEENSEWDQAITSELLNMTQRKVWDVVTLPKG